MRGEGVKWLSLVVSFVVALSIVGAVQAPVTVPLLYVNPAVSTANPPEYFTINLNIQDVVDMYSWGAKLVWNPNVLEVAYYYIGSTKVYNITEGPFLKDGTTSPDGTSFTAIWHLDYIDAGCTTLGVYPGVSGSGVLLTVVFKVKDSGKSALDLQNTSLLRLDIPTLTLYPITHNAQDGSFYTTAQANLVGKSGWPEHHHFVVSKDEDFDGTYSNQTLYAKVTNLGPLNLYVRASFDLVENGGMVVTVTSWPVVVAPGATVVISANFELSGVDAGKFYANASVYYSWSGYYWTQGDKIKAFSFAVIP